MEAKDIVAVEVFRQAQFGCIPSQGDLVTVGIEEGIKEMLRWLEQYATHDGKVSLEDVLDDIGAHSSCGKSRLIELVRCRVGKDGEYES